jgi:hypothetical protein
MATPSFFDYDEAATVRLGCIQIKVFSSALSAVGLSIP